MRYNNNSHQDLINHRYNVCTCWMWHLWSLN